ncbi:MAG: entericidin A/B family lipoprotein [Alphaproteobacteria bacterium]|nr:entericidin A/B family lipoprotein [Alphaproteobacteria bacterium]
MKKSLKKSVLIAAVFATVLPALSACNTFAGLGEDVQAGGRAIEREANQAR